MASVFESLSVGFVFFVRYMNLEKVLEASTQFEQVISISNIEQQRSKVGI